MKDQILALTKACLADMSRYATRVKEPKNMCYLDHPTTREFKVAFLNGKEVHPYDYNINKDSYKQGSAFYAIKLIFDKQPSIEIRSRSTTFITREVVETKGGEWKWWLFGKYQRVRKASIGVELNNYSYKYYIVCGVFEFELDADIAKELYDLGIKNAAAAMEAYDKSLIESRLTGYEIKN